MSHAVQQQPGPQLCAPAIAASCRVSAIGGGLVRTIGGGLLGSMRAQGWLWPVCIAHLDRQVCPRTADPAAPSSFRLATGCKVPAAPAMPVGREQRHSRGCNMRRHGSSTSDLCCRGLAWPPPDVEALLMHVGRQEGTALADGATSIQEAVPHAVQQLPAQGAQTQPATSPACSSPGVALLGSMHDPVQARTRQQQQGPSLGKHAQVEDTAEHAAEAA